MLTISIITGDILRVNPSGTSRIAMFFQARLFNGSVRSG